MSPYPGQVTRAHTLTLTHSHSLTHSPRAQQQQVIQAMSPYPGQVTHTHTLTLAHTHTHTHTHTLRARQRNMTRGSSSRVQISAKQLEGGVHKNHNTGHCTRQQTTTTTTT